jgi:hypothetical protein
MVTTLDSRLSITARALARLWADGSLPIEALRREMRQVLANAHTVALLAGTGGQRSPEIDAALRQIIEGEWNELDRLIALLESQPETDIERRLLAFADALDETRADGETLVQADVVDGLVPAAIGGAIGALLERIISQPGRVIIPRLDSRAMQGVTAELQRRMDELSDLYTNGELLLDDWHERMRRELRIAHQVLYQAGKSGPLTPDDLARINQRVQEQIAYLDGFRADIEAGKLTPAQIRTRAQMYVKAGYASLQEGGTVGRGMPVLPAYPTMASECRINCRCYWRIIQLDEPGAWDCTWVSRASEVCPQCVARAAEWRPLQIRNWEIQPYNSAGLFICPTYP